ncbi:MFS transporter [Streptomyces sp. TRM72054]|uniref:MFS transporter n=1 Tax=Streptomyces sp. TRM72054 TaxID=2870562 RepID=UPI001C8C4FDA|nr:MFS transporter [Streptomyces sp. TRM72054]MBX9399498.1 MFS transporter [Streptomyces sp. TRM72054]
MRGILRRIGELLPHHTAGRTLAVSAGIDSLGTGMFLASSALYFVSIVGIPAGKVALGTTVAGALALLAPVPLGRLADRCGAGRFYVTLLLLRAVGYSAYAFVSGFTGYLILTVLLTALDRSYAPIQQAMVSTLVNGRDRTRTMASIRSVRNVGITVGFLLAGVVFAAGHPTAFMAIFLGNGLTFVVTAIMVRRVLPGTEPVGQSCTAAEVGTSASAVRVARSPFRDWWFMVFTACNGILSLYDTMLIVLLPVWVLKYTQAPTEWVPVLMAVNTVLTVVLQVYVAKYAEGTATAMRMLVLSGFLMVACCGFFAIGQASSNTVAMIAVLLAVVVLTVAETLQAVGAWELSAVLSPEADQGRYLGAFSLSVTGQKAVGPVLLVVLLMPAGLLAWPVLAGAFAVAALLCRTAARRSLAERAHASEFSCVAASAAQSATP